MQPLRSTAHYLLDSSFSLQNNLHVLITLTKGVLPNDLATLRQAEENIRKGLVLLGEVLENNQIQ